MKLKFLLLMCVLCMSTAGLLAQDLTITGTVRDEQGSLPGVNVTVKGRPGGTTTDNNGFFSIAAGPEDVLMLSFIGYELQEVPVNNRTTIDVSMISDITQLGEVVVVGYGEQKKAHLTGSVSALNLNEVKNAPVTNAAAMLQGRMPGVTVSNFSTQPGVDNPEIRIRGVGTLNAGSNPLVIVDGVQSQLGQIPTSDIESISVLKDAASASIYGVRAANGVILITTKRGKIGAPRINFNSSISLQKSVTELDLVDSWDHARIANLIRTEKGAAPLFSDAQIQAMRDGSDPDHFANTDWWDEMYRTAPMQKYYLSVDGGSENVKYMLSGEVLDQKGIMIGTRAQRYSFRSNIDVKASKKLNLGMNVYGYKRKVEEPLNAASGGGENGLNYSIRRFTSPTVPVKYSNGNWGAADGLYGAGTESIRNVVQLSGLGDNFTDFYRLEGKVFGDLEIIPKLHLKSSLSAIHNSSAQDKFSPTNRTYNAEGTVIGNNTINSLTNNAITNNQFLVENLLTYSRTFNESHNFSVLLGNTQQYYRYDYFQAYIESFPNNEIHELGAGSKNPKVEGNAKEEALQSYFGRMNYDYQGKYLFEVSVRHDGTSRFPTDNRWGTFPSFSGGWVISEEAFAQNLKAVSFLKVRGSWGKLGNQDLGDDPMDYYPYSQTIAADVRYPIGGVVQGGVAVKNLANTNINWETTTVTDIGLDVNLFNNRIQIVADYFDKTTTDILMQLPISYNLGNVNPPFQNVAEVKNTGWELAINYQETIGKVGVTAGFNISRFKNEITELGGLEEIINGDYINRVGSSIGSYYGYVSEGYFTDADDIAGHATQFTALRPGDVKYADISGPDGTPDGKITADDRQILGSAFPKLTYGFNLGATYAGFDVSMLFQGVSGIKRWQFYNNEEFGTYTTAALNYWTPENPGAEFARWGNVTNNNAMSSFWLQDASYLRLKNLEVGYTIPKALLERVSLNNVRVYFSGFNLVTWTDMKDYDPERTSDDDRSRSYPQTKIYSLGLNVTF